MPRAQSLDRLRSAASAAPQILPSLLLCDFANLQREVGQLESAGIRALHLDVMDGHFVPNLTYGMPIVEALRRVTDLPLDVHLMIAEPERYVRPFAEAGADLITVHVEATNDPVELLREIRSLDVATGIALNPDTPLTRLEGCYPWCDLVLVMSVPAGFGGQSFRRDALDKLKQVRKQAGPDVLLEIDGGINRATIGDCVGAGAQLLVVGSAIFRAASYPDAVAELRSIIGERRAAEA